ncbi:penicillin-binding protein 2 [Methylomagnum ishizawai]|uniref:Peptidoglycan D,D-transpeptidase MrdA n=1 Tax=Methylomagnum ishizawai TaxID=1760988 RepID=A0A1Y6CUR7_9GAMM|nr:penicillin-binding protein 2 [Methylomagnum ishizawai]SMF94057.1 penicillin-binding protein 2 [Methylomagnum ishizawai]
MDREFIFKDNFRENRMFLNRIVASVIGMLALTLALVARLIYLQVVGHELYTNLSHDNQVKIAPLAPSRGLIFDRNGEVLADNIATYSLEIVPEQVPDLKATLAELKALINIGDEEIARFQTQRGQRKSFESVPLRLELSEEDIARFAVKMPYFPGVEIRTRLLRAYPYADLTAHAVGYVGRINEAELQVLDPAQYRGTYHIGKTGVEKSYEAILHGKTGYEEYETNVQGRAIQVLGTTDPLTGADLYLSLDIRLQKTALDALGEYSGAVVAIEPATGKVLAMASKPSFDPNPFIHGIGKELYDSLQNDKERPLYDRVLRGVYPPGSTVKPFVALAGMEYLDLNPGKKSYCPGYYKLPNSDHKYRDWRKGGHGPVDLRLALVQSCDVYFYELANHIGIDHLQEYMSRFGFGRHTGIDLEGEKSGLFPSREWKKKKRKTQQWFPGETLIAGIGQGYVQVTPLQLARAVAMLANQGHSVEPRLVDSIKAGYAVDNPYPRNHEETVGQIDHKRWQAIADAMIDVVHSQRGTAKGIAPGLRYHMAGKTGTAQVFTVGQGQDYKKMNITKEMRDHAWFVAFAPAENPRIAVAVIAEHGGHGGSVAAPIARAVMDQYLNERP